MSGFKFDSGQALAIIITPLAVGFLCLALVLYRRHRRQNAIGVGSGSGSGIVQPLVHHSALRAEVRRRTALDQGGGALTGA